MIERWRWRPYEGLARKMSLRYGVAPELILAVMGIESAFDPRAFRDEPQIGDASRGLMQLLLKTARGLGFTGAPDELYDADVNADLGTKYLAQLLRARGDMAKALSNYNGGYRPSLGFGEPTLNGKFRNQAYVDKALQAWREFTNYFAATATTPTLPLPSAPPPATPNSGTTPALLLAAGVLAGWLLLRFVRGA